LLQDLQEHVGAAPSEEQLDQLNEMIARSQRSFKELIDSFDDAACAVSLDGTLRTVNKRVSELVGLPYTAIVGQKFFEFLDEPTRASVEAGLMRFLEKRHWAGTVRVRFKNNDRPLYFDCVLNAIVKSGEVVGLSVLGRDVTGQHEKELRFTELFETLQEGAYFSTPEGRLLDANPALVSILGYATKDELLALDPIQLNPDPKQPPVLGRAPTIAAGCAREKLRCVRKMGVPRCFSNRLARCGMQRAS
jgi:PAS domain S-box-containing protein